MKFVTPPMFEQNTYGVDVNPAFDHGDAAAQVEAERIEVYRKYRQKLIEATDLIEQLAADFTELDFDDEREAEPALLVAKVENRLWGAVTIRNGWFYSRINLAKGGEA